MTSNAPSTIIVHIVVLSVSTQRKDSAATTPRTTSAQSCGRVHARVAGSAIAITSEKSGNRLFAASSPAMILLDWPAGQSPADHDQGEIFRARWHLGLLASNIPGSGTSAGKGGPMSRLKEIREAILSGDLGAVA